MRDDPVSQYIRQKKNLPDNWRVYEMAAAKNFTATRFTGALVRPVDPVFEPHIGRDFDWIRPLQCKAQLTLSEAEYELIYREATHD
jgi:hypothetical protein